MVKSLPINLSPSLARLLLTKGQFVSRSCGTQSDGRNRHHWHQNYCTHLQTAADHIANREPTEYKTRARHCSIKSEIPGFWSNVLALGTKMAVVSRSCFAFAWLLVMHTADAVVLDMFTKTSGYRMYVFQHQHSFHLKLLCVITQKVVPLSQYHYARPHGPSLMGGTDVHMQGTRSPRHPMPLRTAQLMRTAHDVFHNGSSP